MEIENITQAVQDTEWLNPSSIFWGGGAGGGEVPGWEQSWEDGNSKT